MKNGFLALLFFFWIAPPPVLAQNAISTGGISGWVVDPSGAAIPGASVVVTNTATGVRQAGKTNGVGLYLFSVLSPGAYTLTFNKTGFKVAEIRNVIVQIGQTTDVNVVLEVGSLSESISVTAGSQLLHPSESSVSTVVNQTLIRNLPLSGRRFTDLVLLTRMQPPTAIRAW